MTAAILIPLLLAGGAASPQPRPLFTQHERQTHAEARPNPRCKPEPHETASTYSDVTVFDSREVEYRISTVVRCLGQPADPSLVSQWDAPGGAVRVFRDKLSAPDFEQFKIFLDREDVRNLHDFMNAGPGVGDFKIAITRPEGPQNIEVLSLSPNHYSLIKEPSLTHLVCKAKEIARRASGSGELPDWCRSASPLK